MRTIRSTQIRLSTHIASKSTKCRRKMQNEIRNLSIERVVIHRAQVTSTLGSKREQTTLRNWSELVLRKSLASGTTAQSSHARSTFTKLRSKLETTSLMSTKLMNEQGRVMRKTSGIFISSQDFQTRSIQESLTRGLQALASIDQNLYQLIPKTVQNQKKSIFQTDPFSSWRSESMKSKCQFLVKALLTQTKFQGQSKSTMTMKNRKLIFT